jgi:hypothetical protein
MTKPPSVSDTITKRGPLKREAIDVRYNNGRKTNPHTQLPRSGLVQWILSGLEKQAENCTWFVEVFVSTSAITMTN